MGGFDESTGVNLTISQCGHVDTVWYVAQRDDQWSLHSRPFIAHGHISSRQCKAHASLIAEVTLGTSNMRPCGVSWRN